MDRELLDRETWSLNKDEAEAVKKRVDTLNATLRKRRQHRADVREIFAAPMQVIHSAILQPIYTGVLSLAIIYAGGLFCYQGSH